MREIYLVFTRDHNEWTNEMVNYVFVHELKRIFGAGLSTQITHYTGRTSEWYRYVDEMNGWKDAVIKKKLSASIFSQSAKNNFFKQINDLRKFISISPAKIKNEVLLLKNIRELFIKMYPYYLLALFIPSAWREEFVKAHPSNNEKILKNFLAARDHSEGVLKEVTNFMRIWLGPKLVEHGFPFDNVKLLSLSEVENLIKNKKLPPLKTLQARAVGFVHLNNKIIPVKDFFKFINKLKVRIKVEPAITSVTASVSGVAAYLGPIVRGVVKIVLNSNEMSGFKPGMILVSPMTAPENLSIMKIASAIVTDEGGITCHAAIVARELKKPCVIGTRNATKIFKDGDLVEVDANKGIVRKINS